MLNNTSSGKKARVFLIMPPYNRLKGFYQKSFSMALGYIGAALERECYTVGIYCSDNNNPKEVSRFGNYLKTDCWRADMRRHQEFVKSFENLNNFDYVWDEVRDVISDFAPDVIGITSSTSDYQPALVIAEIIKNLNKNILTVFGGPHPTALPDEVLLEKNVDFVVRGEGEITFLELLGALNKDGDVSQVKGLSFKKNGTIIHNPRRELINEIDSMPFPARHLLINKVDQSRGYLSTLFNEVLASRGCPYQCKFCAANTVWERKHRDRSVESIVQEIKFLIREYGINYVRILSDTISANREWMVNFCEAIKPLKITWSGTTRINTLDEFVLQFMKESGCVHVHIGIESGNDRILREIKKGIKVSQVKKAANMLNRVGLPWSTFFLIGFPEESRTEIEDTFRLMQRLKPLSHKIAVLVPYPGTEYYDILKKEGDFPDKINWNWFDGRSSYLIFTKKISKSEFIKLRNKIFGYVDRYNSKRKKWNELKMIITISIKLIFTDPLLFLKKAINKL